jgi:exopolysaccharide biosynthesis WecB/TagA/CpsF family protein
MPLSSTTIRPLKRLLAVELADIGDLILTTPALAALHETFPATKIDVLTTAHAAPVLDNTGLADEVIVFNKFSFDRPADLLKPNNLREGWLLANRLRASHYDAVLIFHHLTTRFGAWKYTALALATAAPIRAGLDNGRGWFLTHRVIDRGFGAVHQVQYWLEVVGLLGATTQDQRLRVGISDADRQWARAHLPPGRALVAIHPGSGGYSMARRWEPEKFASVADALSEQATIVLVGGLDDQAEAVLQHMQHAPINLAGKTTLGQLAAVISRCEAYIGADSGVMHLASAVLPSKAKLAALFGPSNDQAWGPWQASADTDTVSLIKSGVLCSPCSYIGHTVGLRHGCEARTCMKLIMPYDVQIKQSVSAQKITRSGPRTAALRILGVPVDAPTFASLFDQIGEWIEDFDPVQGARQICTVNPEFIMTAQTDINFYNILNRCDLCIPDGVGLLWAARRLGHPLLERVTGSDGVPLIAERAARHGWRLFLLGAAPGVAEKAAQILMSRYPGLKIVGTYAGTPSAQDEDKIAALVAASGADILFVAYGAPNQDKWIARNMPGLNVKVAMGVGGSLDFIAGVTVRAPLWMRQAGIEWLHRLIKQPWRVRRMLRLPIFILAVLRRGSRGPAAFVGLNNTGKFS